jgi:hypothetical protein
MICLLQCQLADEILFFDAERNACVGYLHYNRQNIFMKLVYRFSVNECVLGNECDIGFPYQ